RSKRQIKPLLLDQTFMAGMGNIYTDESLFIASIHPTTPANLILFEKAVLLLGAIREVLGEGIKRNGASIDWVYRGGDFQNHFKVYQRDGEACHCCGATLQRMVVGQRGTHFCPHCQPKAA
ncbi:MAG: zinc finger domain-containing protein, partial [Anaerolineaceae bacterium]|nr:zinc finger domain-containing protein [Anaerolineaceae bacterium]